jgi:UDP-N-acetylglucosamine 2-epimerase (non-hydrolysing)
MHRRENHKNLEEWFTAFNMLQKENPHLRFVFVSHPSPAVAEKTHLLLNIDILPPVTHDEFLELLASAAVVITDSGGVQEEASFLGKRHIVCREHTERPTGYRCKKPYELPGIGLNGGVFYRLLESNNWWQKCPYGCGNSAQKVVEVLKCL